MSFSHEIGSMKRKFFLASAPICQPALFIAAPLILLQCLAFWSTTSSIHTSSALSLQSTTSIGGTRWGCQQSPRPICQGPWKVETATSPTGSIGQRVSRIASLNSPLWRRQPRTARSSTTARPMVLTTPESVFEQVSTQNLLDDLIDESVKTSSGRPLIMQFQPSSGWLWKQWKGTVFSETWTSCVSHVVYAVAVYFLYKANPGIQQHLSGFGSLWGQLLSVTTFTLTFFVNQSYALWRKCRELSGALQGRLTDVGLNMATHAERKSPSSPSELSTFTPASRQILELMSRYTRLFNILTYASFTRPYRPLLTPRGMRRLVDRGLMTPTEREVLVDAYIPATQRHSAVLMWMIRLFVEARKSGHVGGGPGFEQQTMEKFHAIKATCGAIGDELQGRMALAYAHIVQVLVDVILWMYPIMALSTGMSPFLVFVGTGLLTVSYQGLFDLAKHFLDPYNNENYGTSDDSLRIETLIADTNAGSVRWMYGFEEMPFSAQQLTDGELYDQMLPVRGYSVEELEQLEQERANREKLQQELEERREAEEFERLRMAAAEAERLASSNVTNAEATDEGTNAGDRTGAIGDLNASEFDQAMGEGQSEESEDDGGFTFDVIDPYDTTVDEEELLKLPARPSSDAQALPSKSIKNITQDERDDTFVPDMVNFEMFKDLPWFQETGPDGQEYRLSQMLADEEYEEEKVEEAPIKTFDEYAKKVAEIEEAVENEIQETAEIMNASPGSSGMDLSETELREEESGSPKYDQTKLDGISQLWGLAPEDPSSLGDAETPEAIEEVEFDSVSQLWGLPANPSTEADDEPDVGMPSFSGVSELWGEQIEGLSEEGGLSTSPVVGDRAGETGLPLWRRDVGPDGKEVRLSQLLADEEWEEAIEPVPMEPMTLEEYNQEVAERLSEAEEERLEEEAILEAAPGLDPAGWDDDLPSFSGMNQTSAEDVDVDDDVDGDFDGDDDNDRNWDGGEEDLFDDSDSEKIDSISTTVCAEPSEMSSKKTGNDAEDPNLGNDENTVDEAKPNNDEDEQDPLKRKE